MAASVEQQIREQYPSMAWLLNDPEIGQLLRDAVDPSKGFSPQSFEAKVKGTNWYKKRTQSQRDWETLWHTDNATARQRLTQYTNAVQRQAQRMGVNITASQLRWIAASGIQQGWDPSGPEILSGLGKLYSKQPSSGAITTAAQRATAIASGQYMVPISAKSAQVWGNWIAQGLKTEEDFAANMRNAAISKFPHLKAQIEAGETPEQIFSPHRQAIASTLELSPGEVNLLDGKWSKILNTYDKNLKRNRPMTIYETEVLARQDERYWRTKNGQDAQAETANKLLELFGKRA